MTEFLSFSPPFPTSGTQVFNLGVLSVESTPAQLIIISYAFLNLVIVRPINGPQVALLNHMEIMST